jgi:CBS domain-containing protein
MSSTLRCDEVMKRNVHSIRERDSLQKAAQLMREQDIGFLPVLDRRGKVVGIVTDRDIVIRGCESGACASTTPVRDVMTLEAITCRPEDLLTHAEALMSEHHISRLPIVDRGALVGIVSLSDVAQYDRPTRIGRTVQRIAERKYAPERP